MFRFYGIDWAITQSEYSGLWFVTDELGTEYGGYATRTEAIRAITTGARGCR